jgi:hypothetical protein
MKSINHTLIWLTLGASLGVNAEILKFAVISEDKPGVIMTHWWPRLPPLFGWKHEQAESELRKLNLIVPEEGSVHQGKTLIYGRAGHINGEQKKLTLGEMMLQNKVSFLAIHPDTSVEDAPTLETADKKKVLTRTFLTTGKKGRFERVANFIESEYLVTIVISSSSKEALDNAMPAYEDLISRYREVYPDTKDSRKGDTYQLERK